MKLTPVLPDSYQGYTTGLILKTLSESNFCKLMSILFAITTTDNSWEPSKTYFYLTKTELQFDMVVTENRTYSDCEAV